MLFFLKKSESLRNSQVKIANIYLNFLFAGQGSCSRHYVNFRFLDRTQSGQVDPSGYGVLSEEEIELYKDTIQASIENGFITTDSQNDSVGFFYLTDSGRSYFSGIIDGRLQWQYSNKKNRINSILKEFEKESPDWRVIEKIGKTAVDSNSQSVRFSVDAGHINRLGFELVSKQETALIELIKNAYDADATEVNIEFKNYDKSGGSLVITDNGVGMSLDVIRDTWMKISTDHKKNNAISTKYGRVRSGRKGIGRFAVQRLGTKLELITCVEGETKGFKIIFNWSVFDSGKDLSDVFSQVEFFKKKSNEHGTTLLISDLREAWSDALIRKVWKNVILLQSPFLPVENSNDCSNDPYKKDIGFNVVINSESSKKIKQEMSIEKDLLSQSIAYIQGTIDDEGLCGFTVTSKKMGFSEKFTIDDRRFLLIGKVAFEAHYFIYKADLISGLSLRAVQNFAEEYGGIRIYRNGFRVLPYGERTDDWLRLDRDVGRRNLLVPASNTHFIGKVMLSDDNVLIEETSSREGLLENEAFRELSDCIRAVLENSALRVAAIRGKKQRASQKDFGEDLIPIRPPIEVIGELKKDLKEVVVSEKNNRNINLDLVYEKIDSKFKGAEIEIEDYQKKVEYERESSLRYEEMLRILSSLGISISIFGHEMKGAQSTIKSGFIVLERSISLVNNPDLKSKLNEQIKYTKKAADRIISLGGYIDKINSSNENRLKKSFAIKGAVERFFEQFKDYLSAQSIKLQLDLLELNLRTIPMHASEIDSILLNFMTNSVKAIKKSKHHERGIRVAVSSKDNMISLVFEDTGIGVDDSIKHKIFLEFFTTTIGMGDNALEGTGTGLGLKIVSDIASSYGGEVSVVDPSEGYNFAIQLLVPKIS